MRRAAQGVAALALLAACAPPPEPPEARARALAPFWRLLLPPGPGPHPAALLLSGCDGVHDNMGFWAEALVAGGRAALIVDSHAPRGLAEDEAWRLVCAGGALRGATRAGDLAVALDALRRTEGIDGSDVVVLGASHGAWAAMEFVARAGTGAALPGLTAWPEPPGAMLDRVSALVLLYPYCGFLNDARAEGWAEAPPTLMVLAGEDSVVSAPACLARAEELRAAGARVEAEVLPGADHAFDQEEKSPTSPLPFDAGAREQARALVAAWLAEAPR